MIKIIILIILSVLGVLAYMICINARKSKMSVVYAAASVVLLIAVIFISHSIKEGEAAKPILPINELQEQKNDDVELEFNDEEASENSQADSAVNGNQYQSGENTQREQKPSDDVEEKLENAQKGDENDNQPDISKNAGGNNGTTGTGNTPPWAGQTTVGATIDNPEPGETDQNQDSGSGQVKEIYSSRPGTARDNGGNNDDTEDTANGGGNAR